MSETEPITIYVGTDDLLVELRELGYEDSIELEDLIDLIEEDDELIEQLRPTLLSLPAYLFD